MSKQFLAVGDYLINPELLTYAVFEQRASDPQLRLGFATRGAGPQGELCLTGDDARELLRWLRLNAVFLSSGGGFGSNAGPVQPVHATDSQTSVSHGHDRIGASWGSLSAPVGQGTGGFFSRAGERS